MLMFHWIVRGICVGILGDIMGTWLGNLILFLVFFKHNFCVKPYVPREPGRDPSNRRLNEH